MLLPSVVPIDDASRIAEVRRLAAAAAFDEGLDEAETGRVALIATELATNGLKHAEKCEIIIARLSPHDRPGVELISIDRGPGMTNVDDCFVDGFSTAGTPGLGFGGITRQADEFDVYTQPGKGTAIVARKYARAAATAKTAPSFRFSSICVPYRGEAACGDAWSVRRNGSSLWIVVADGLGHGLLASQASQAATAAFDSSKAAAPVELLDVLHRSLRGTRGAAVAVARIEVEDGRIRYAGLGNISGALLGGVKVQNMLSHNGTAGLEARRCQEFEYKLPEAGLLVMHSDGLTTSWNLDAYPGILRRHPALIAAVLYRDANRGRDDVCVVVGRRFENDHG